MLVQRSNKIQEKDTSTKYDVIICGSGSAGLAAATWLSRYGIRCKILDKRDGPMQMGQADGVQCRTVEIFESLGLVEDLLRDSYHVLEITFWSSKGDSSLQRDRRTPDTEPGLSHQPHVILNQARVNKMLIKAMERANNQTIDYGYEITGVHVNNEEVADATAHCVTVMTKRAGKEEKFQAKYVLACDGAHSAVRKSLGFKMVGDSTNNVWGVMDVYPRTDFPDIRKKAIVQATAGTLMIIPREGQHLVRFYIELGHDIVAKNVTLADLQDTARRIFAPYRMEIADTFWWSAYSIGQRLADYFHQDHRVFLSGDACHTHSPKAGQGMNVSLQDGYNIGWKLGSVLTGQSHPDLLKTYVQERAAVAAQLIEFDRNWTKLFSHTSQHQNAATPEYLSEQFIKNARYTAGLTAQYGESIITKYPSSTAARSYAKGLTAGMRLPSTKVVRHCDARSLQLLTALPADGRWRILIFPGRGDIKDPKSSASRRINDLATFLSSPTGPIISHPASQPYVDSFIEPLLILSGQRTEIEQDAIPDFFWPTTGPWQQRDLHKTLVDDQSYDLAHGQAYQFYGIDQDVGAMIVVRPDQYVSMITAPEDFSSLTSFFTAFRA